MDRVVGAAVLGEPAHRHEGRRRELDLTVRVRAERVLRTEPAVGDHLGAAHDHLVRGVDRAEEEPGVEALWRDLGRDPARDRDEAALVEGEAGLLVRLADRGAERAVS
jgi:hypothetical protein